MIEIINICTVVVLLALIWVQVLHLRLHKKYVKKLQELEDKQRW